MSSDDDGKQILGTAPYFMVKNLEASLKYYHEVLGFNLPKAWGDPPRFAMPSLDGFIFMLNEVVEGTDVIPIRQREGVWDAYIWITDADSTFSKFRDKGAEIVYEPCIQEEYDMKEFAIGDPDGHVIAFGQHYDAQS